MIQIGANMTIMDSSIFQDMKDTIESMLPDTCTKQERTQQKDPTNPTVTIEVWTDSSTTYSCRLDAKSEDTDGAMDSVKHYHRYILTLPYDADIDTDDRIKIGTDVFNVASVDDSKSWMACKRFFLELL